MLAEHDPRWAERFTEVAQLIRPALGARARTVEHIGSTAVPGLIAKPIVDVLLTVADLADEAAWLPPLEASGLVLRVREPDHRMLRTPPTASGTRG